MPEKWLPVVGFEGRYEVSDLGRVKSLARVVPCKGGSRVLRERILKPKTGATGRLELSLGKGASRRVHRLVLDAFVGPCPLGMQACHRDGNALLGNLRWDTPKANSDDKERHGRMARRERHGNAKLTESAVAEIRSWLKRGKPTRALARAHGVCQATIVAIGGGATWR